jgi:UDP:flavonoid glycosyltransferase YjiC (YdhE family)
MVPVARAAEVAGHVVAFACQAAMVATVEEAGFTADQPRNAQRCNDLHVARVLHALEATPDRVRAAASDVLADPTYRLNAERMRDEIAVLPGPDHAVTLLKRLATTRRPLQSGRGARAGRKAVTAETGRVDGREGLVVDAGVEDNLGRAST